MNTIVQGAASVQDQVRSSGGEAQAGAAPLDRSIGDIISETKNLSAERVEQILAYQRTHGVRFGEAAVALGLASPEDVLFALSQQFHYPYAGEEQRRTSPELVALNQPFAPQAEAFRAIRSQLIMRGHADGATGAQRAIAVVSAESGDGKTFFAANLAVVLAQLGRRTLLVDADLRSPRQHEVFHLRNDAGLSGVLSGRAEGQVIQQIQGVPSLFVLSAGVTPPNPIELVERPAFSLLMKELVEKFDYVVVDTPAATQGADASVIAARCGQALVVARKGESRWHAVQDLVGNLSNTPTQVSGVVLNEY
jgi:protein-tyrosine kinase